MIRLSANEGALGVSPHVKKALQDDGMAPHRYPEVQDQHLNTAIAERYGLDSSRILSSNGSDELISLITMAYLEPGDEVVMSQYAFLVIPQATRIAGGTVVKADDVGMAVSYTHLRAHET